MKRTALLVLLALGVGLALGAAKSRKFRYLDDRWNRTVKLTEIEVACIQSQFRAQEPVVLRAGHLAAREIAAEPRARHLRVTVQVDLLGGAGKPPGPGELDAACDVAFKYWLQRRFRRSLDEGECPVTIDLARGAKVLYRQIRDEKGKRGFQNPQL